MNAASKRAAAGAEWSRLPVLRGPFEVRVGGVWLLVVSIMDAV